MGRDDISLAWPAGESEMARRIRQHDWATTPLGPIADWPQSLRTAVDLVLASPIANILVCGPHRVLIYNDGCIALYGAKHPRALGASAADVFRELWADIGPLYDRVFRGEALSFKAQPWAFERGAAPNEGFYDAYFTPGRDEAGRIAFAHVAAIEVTEKVRTEAAMRESQARLTAAFQSVPAGLAAIDLDGRVVVANDQYRHYLPSVIPSRDPDRGAPWQAWDEQGQPIAPSDFPGSRAIRGESVIPGQEMLYTDDDGRPRWTNVATAPTLDAAGQVTGLVSVITDIDERKRAVAALQDSEERQTFLLRFTDALRAERSADAVVAIAVEMLAEELRLDRCYATAMYPALDRVDVTHEVRRPELAPIPSSLRFTDFPEAGRQSFERTLVFNDTATDPDLTDADKRALAAMNFGALLSRPLREGPGKPIWALGAVSMQPRRWSAGEVALVEEATERTWAAMERARAEAALRESEERFRRSVLEAPIPVIMHAEDGEVLQVSRSWTELTGYTIEDADAIHSWLTQAYGAGGEGVRHAMERAFEDRDGELPMRSRVFPIVTRQGEERHWSFSASSPGTLRDGRHFVVGMAEDITERVRAEEQLRENEDRQAFLLTLSDAFRAEPDADAIVYRGLRTLTERLRLDRCYVGVYRIEDDRAEFTHQLGNDLVPPLPSGIRLSDVPEALQIARDNTLVINDLSSATFLSDSDKLTIGGLGLRALVAATARNGEGNPLWAIVAVSASPRLWTSGEIALIEQVTERTWTAMERARTETTLRESEERLRLALLAGRAYSFEIELETRAISQSGDANSVLGFPMPDDEGERLAMVHPDDRALVEAAFNRALGERVSYRVEHRLIPPDGGEPVWVRVEAEIFGDGGNKLVGFVRNTTAEREAESRLRESEERLALAIEIGELAAWDWHLPSGKVAWNMRHYTMEGYEPGEVEPSFEAWAARVHPHDRDDTIARIEYARDAHEAYVHEFRFLRPAGSICWASARGQFFYDAQGQPLRMIGVMEDVTERKEAEAALLDGQKRQAVLVAELQHRTRNLITVVGALSQRTADESGSLEDFRERFRHRLAALSRVQGLLSQLSAGAQITFGDLLRSELTALGAPAERLTLDGPEDVTLRSGSVQTFSLALHELATNAVKYGAFAAPDGRLAVRWTTAAGPDGSQSLRVDWRERGVAVAGREIGDERGGYGRELIEQALPYQLGAATAYELTPDGVHCTIEVPLGPEGPSVE